LRLGRRETRETLDFRAAKGIADDVEMIRADEIDAAFDRMQKSEIKYRFVIDNVTLAA
jgi:alcohol dehydrogenase (NADP+)